MTQPPKTYVLYTEHKKEDHLAEYLNSTVQKLYPEAAARIYVPKAIRMWHYRDRDGNKKWKEVEEPLFFNYVFVESSNVEALNQILKSLRIETTYHIVGKNRIPDMNATYEEHPIVPVSDMEMEKIKTLTGETDDDLVMLVYEDAVAEILAHTRRTALIDPLKKTAR
ncbi:MAG: hypothetical protein IJS86_08390, partial [Lachnospiraceae bacterium]|nr:hypothetical protein [Lachnospiraceae bacterium]